MPSVPRPTSSSGRFGHARRCCSSFRKTYFRGGVLDSGSHVFERLPGFHTKLHVVRIAAGQKLHGKVPSFAVRVKRKRPASEIGGLRFPDRHMGCCSSPSLQSTLFRRRRHISPVEDALDLRVSRSKSRAEKARDNSALESFFSVAEDGAGSLGKSTGPQSGESRRVRRCRTPLQPEMSALDDRLSQPGGVRTAGRIGLGSCRLNRWHVMSILKYKNVITRLSSDLRLRGVRENTPFQQKTSLSPLAPQLPALPSQLLCRGIALS